MTSRKLTNDDRDRISNNIIRPIVEESGKVFQKFGEFADKYFKSLLPFEVIEFMNKYPNLVNIRGGIYLSSFTSERFRYVKSYIKTTYYVDCFVTEEKYEELKNLTETKSFVKKMIELDRKASNIRNRTKCALESINTSKQLKDNFPEAYAIFMEAFKEDVKKNGCDDIEKLRAELLKL